MFLEGVDLQCPPSRLQAALAGELCELSQVCRGRSWQVAESQGTGSNIVFTRSHWHPCGSY